MQNDFTEKGAILEIESIENNKVSKDKNNLNKFKRFIDKCREKGVLIIYTRHCFSPEQNPVEAKLFPELAKEGLRKDSKGWQICEELKPNLEMDDIIVDKTRYDAFFKTDLKKILDKKNVRKVIITGTMTEVCCESTARTAMYNDYEVLFCSDLTFCCDKNTQKNTLEVMKRCFGEVMDSKKILNFI